MHQKIKIIMIGPFPKNDNHGGISSVISSYFSCDIFKENNIKYIATSCSGNVIKKIMSMATSMFKLVICLVFVDIKLLHIHTASWRSFYRKSAFVFIGKIFRKKVILHIHGGEFNLFYAWGPKINQWFITKVLDSADMILVLSDAWVNEIKSKSNTHNIRIVYNPVNTRDFQSLSYKNKRTKENINVIFLGRLSANKGIYDLLKVMSLVLEKEPYVRFVLCGDGDIDNCRLICEQQGFSDKVIFCGWVYGQKKIDEIRNADVFVLPSYNEGLPVSILEAMSAGLPIVSTNVGGIPNIIKDGINGFLFKPGDVKAIADGIIKFARDGELRTEIGEYNSIQANNLFDVDIVVKQLFQIYKELLVMTETTNTKVLNKTG